MAKKSTKPRLEEAIRLTRFDALKAAEEETGFEERSSLAEAFFNRGVAGGWRDILSATQVKEIVAANHAAMRRFGYLDEKLERFAPAPAAPRPFRAGKPGLIGKPFAR